MTKGQKDMKQLKIKFPLVGLANELAQGEPIRIRYGTYPFGKRTFRVNGKDVEFLVEQAFTRESAQAIQAAFANEMAKGNGKGIPIYFGHPDVPELAVKYPDKRAYGWVKSVTAGVVGMELVPVWNEEPGDHFSHFSPYWDGRITLSRNGTAMLHVRRIKSIGCINHPNISEFALPNEEGETQTEEGTIMDLAKLIALLGLAEDATEEAVAAEITRLKTETADAQTRAEAEEKETAFANERTARVKLSLDHALADGRITPAMRAAWEKRLADDFDAGSVALANEKPVVKTGETAKPRLADYGAQEANVAQQIVALANEEIVKTPGLQYSAAYDIVRKKNPELFK
jgi:hypothetical protein